MKALRRISAALSMAAVLLSCSQFDSEITVKNLAFEVQSDIVWNAEYMAYTLRLSLEEGEEGNYLFTYAIDNDPLVKLSSTGGSAIESGKEIALSDKNPVICLLPALGTDTEHSLKMTFSRDGVTRTYTKTLPDTSQKGIGIRIDTDPKLDFSRVVLTNLMGATVTTYNVTFYLDGELLTGIKYMSNTFDGQMDIDFARSESYTFELPYLIAGDHIIKIDVKSSLGAESSRLAFTEPQRRQTALTFSYNAYTGRLMVESAYNPLGTAFDITIDMTVTGYIRYRPKQFFGVAKEHTDYFTKTGESSTRLTPTITAAQIDGGKLKSLMDEIYSNTRTDASNAIGNGNARTLHADITSITLKFTVHSLGDYAGKTVVTIAPSTGSNFPISYKYEEQTWFHTKGSTQTFKPNFTVNGLSPSIIRTL